MAGEKLYVLPIQGNERKKSYLLIKKKFRRDSLEKYEYILIYIFQPCKNLRAPKQIHKK